MKINMQSNIQRNGYTLLEVLLSLTIISLIAGFSIPVYQIFQNRNDLDIAVNSLANSLRKAQFYSQAVKDDSEWSVRLENSRIIVFKGDDFSSRDQEYDELFEISSTINFSGLQEVVFNKFSGEPQGLGTITLTSINNESRNLTINEKGTVDY